MAHVTIYDCTVSYDEADYEEGGEKGIWAGLHYWEKHLNHDEIATFLHAAKEHGSCEFETNHQKRFVVKYQDGGYILEKKY